MPLFESAAHLAPILAWPHNNFSSVVKHQKNIVYIRNKTSFNVKFFYLYIKNKGSNKSVQLVRCVTLSLCPTSSCFDGSGCNSQWALRRSTDFWCHFTLCALHICPNSSQHCAVPSPRPGFSPAGAHRTPTRGCGERGAVAEGRAGPFSEAQLPPWWREGGGCRTGACRPQVGRTPALFLSKAMLFLWMCCCV